MQGLYERLGGQEAIMAAVDIFYKKVTADPRTAPFFALLDMSAQARKQIAFMAWAFGGPEEYRGRALRSAHRDMDLSDEHFDVVATHLGATLEEMGVGDDLINEVLHVLSDTRSEVLDR